MQTIDEGQIKIWKKEHGDVFQLSVDDKVCYLKTPDRKALSYAAAAGASDPLKFNEIILKSCWLGGDEEIKTNDTLFMSVAAKIPELIQIKEAKLVKL